MLSAECDRIQLLGKGICLLLRKAVLRGLMTIAKEAKTSDRGQGQETQGACSRWSISPPTLGSGP